MANEAEIETKNTNYILLKLYQMILHNIDNRTNNITVDIQYEIDNARRVIEIKDIDIEKFTIINKQRNLTSRKIEFDNNIYLNKPIDIIKLYVEFYNDGSTAYGEDEYIVTYGPNDLPKVKKILNYDKYQEKNN